ncbi:MAG: recombinase family protein, partial [Thermoplasmata archaeon]
MKRVAIYTRVSTEDQAKEGFSLDAQMEKLRAYCSARGWEIVKEYVDNGY